MALFIMLCILACKAAEGKRYAISNNQHLSDIPVDIPTNSEEVMICRKPIKKLRANVFSQLSRCLDLNLSSNIIKVIQAGAFTGLQKLERLDLCNNRIEILTPKIFSDLASLENSNYPWITG